LANHVSSGKLASAYPATGWSASASTPANGGTVTVNGDGSLTYTPAGAANTQGGTDSFTVTFDDGHGSQTLAVSVNVGISSSGGLSPNVLMSGTDGSGNFYALFAGRPNAAYTVETNSVTSGGTWVKYQNFTSGADGLINVTNVPPAGSSLFFRTVYPSY
jgi:VCBS repeat-containing protein